jgi:hypothetical protein
VLLLPEPVQQVPAELEAVLREQEPVLVQPEAEQPVKVSDPAELQHRR